MIRIAARGFPRIAAALAIALALAGGAEAKARRVKPTPTTDAEVAEVQRAIDEERYLDAGRMLDQAFLNGAEDPRLILLAGEVSLVRGRTADALADFKQVEGEAAVRTRALEGEGVALSIMGRSDEAMTALKAATAADPAAWRAWNALGGEYDSRRDWKNAEDAYEHAVTASGRAPAALNNRGYSRLLQNRPDEAMVDFVAALAKKPDLAAARTNLRLALAMKGDYERALAGAAKGDEAALLNNAGFAAMMRGDYAQAEALLGRALQMRGEYYSRAAANLELTRSLAARKGASADAAH